MDIVTFRKALEASFKGQKDPMKAAKDRAFGNMVQAASITAMALIIIIAFESLGSETILQLGTQFWYGMAILFGIVNVTFWMLNSIGSVGTFFEMRKAHKVGKVVIEIDGVKYTNKKMPKEILQKAVDQLSEKINASA